MAKRIKVLQLVKAIKVGKFGRLAIHNGFLYITNNDVSIRAAIDCPEKTISFDLNDSLKTRLAKLEILIASGRVGEYVADLSESEQGHLFKGDFDRPAPGQPVPDLDGFSPLIDSEVDQSGLDWSLEVLEGLAWVGLATDTDATRYQLAGVCIDAGKGYAVATDGRRLHGQHFGSGFASAFGQGKTKILHSDFVKSLLTLAKASGQSLNVRAYDNGLRLSCEQFVVWCRWIEGRFPNWEIVVPSYDAENYHKVSFAANLLDVCKAATKIKKLEAKAGEQREDELVPWVRLGESVQTVDARYLAEALAGILDKSATCLGRASLGPANDPTVVGETDGRFAVIMGGSPGNFHKLSDDERAKYLSKYPTLPVTFIS